ncbi:MAG: 30S ribosomal protein S9 [Planctomycetota bacterium]|nr:MAG: 30S ribosomal protein S9 [Planctomycetota bacterium]
MTETTTLEAPRSRGGYPDPSFRGTGRRKTAVARVRILPGSGVLQINGRDLDVHFPREIDQNRVLEPLRVTRALGKYDVFAKVEGGGITGQAGAVSLGIARALVRADASFEPVLRAAGLLTRDPRMVERKKYGQKGARARFQFSKR